MSQVADSMLFRQKLYEMFKDSGLQSKLKTTLRTSLLQKLEKPHQIPISKPQQHPASPFHLRHKFLDSVIAQYFKHSAKEYTLSIFMAECGLEEEDCLRYAELSEILNLRKPSDGQSLLFRLLEEFGKIRCQEAHERSSQTDLDEPLQKKLESVQKDYRSKIDYWKLIPSSSITKTKELVDLEERLNSQFTAEKERLRRDLEITLKQQIQQKLENQYNFRLRDAQKQHEARLNELKLREKAILDGLERKKKDLEDKTRSLSQQEQSMINKHESRLAALQAQYRKRTQELEQKQKEFWKKELELRAKKREYQETIRLVKQKAILQSGTH